MQKIAFYSWQSDLPNSTNRGFIQHALEKAASNIINDETVEVEPVIDRDTRGVAGSPDISTTIFAKIAASDIFIADISLINSETSGRHTPNPNVLIELGYAIRTLNFERVILIFNLAYGKVENLPFDLRSRRVMVYNMPEIVDSRAEERKKLIVQLDDALRGAISHIPNNIELSITEIPSISAIETSQSNRLIILRRDLNALLKRLTDLAPEKFSNGGTEQQLLTSINNTQETIVDFSKIVETIVLMKDKECLIEINKWFGQVFDNYTISKDFVGRFRDGDFDYYRFLGHEMVVTLYAFLMAEEQWDLVSELLGTQIPIKFDRLTSSPADVNYGYASQSMLGIEREQTRLNRISLHGFLLNERHKNGALGSIMPINIFAAADLFLYLHSQLTTKHDPVGRDQWTAWSIIYLKEYPVFLKRAERKSYAAKLATILRLNSTEDLQIKLREKIPNVKRSFTSTFWDLPIRIGDLERVGSIDE